MKKFFLLITLLFALVSCTGSTPPPKTPEPVGIASPTTSPTPLPTALPEPTAIRTPPVGGLYVDPAQTLGPISPYLYGSNYGPWIAVPADMLEQTFASGVTVVRFPGGYWGDHNDVKPYHIDAFMSFIQQMGAKATFTVRLLDGTPEQAAEMVRYTNLEKKYGVEYWAIGNEPTLFADELKVGSYDTKRYNEEWRAIAEAMRAVDPTIKLIGPEIHQYTDDPNVQYKDVNGLNWMDEFLKANGDLVDVVTFHRYPFGVDITKDDLRQNSKEWDAIIPYLRARIHELTGREIPIAITEINTHYNKAVGGEATPDSHYNAIWLADVFGRMMKNDVLMVNHWLLTSSGGQGSWGLIGRGELRPSYYTYQMFTQHFGETLLYSASDDPNVTIYAAQRADGATTLLIINLASETVQQTLTVEGQTAQDAEVWLFDATHSVEQVASLSIGNTTSITLSPESLTLLILAP